ncbi:30S ribosomal protein S3 [Helicovermis profundi]|uniref:Small ribosomal subunit protein uS3 n=1 Tax=Helicovermis profundi TaxID=3065157 RepID=A0AAU9E5Y1_9FIRM|nr:30S ribosomal protein S3 [Clostridia bacterium S502]
MGQKVSPHGLRVGVIKDWDSKWYANKKNFADLLKEDYDIRKFIKKELYTSGISRIYIDRAANNRVRINIFTAKPGMIVGRGGESIKILREKLQKMTGRSIQLDISEVKNTETDAQLVAENVAFSLERRVSFRRAMKQVITRSMRAGVQGIKVSTSGRLGGAEMARVEGYSEGNVPLSTLRADIDYGFAEANTTYGKLGIKVWINHGEVLPTKDGVILQRLQAKPQRDRNSRNNKNSRNSRNNNRNANNRNNKPNNRSNTKNVSK